MPAPIHTSGTSQAPDTELSTSTRLGFAHTQLSTQAQAPNIHSGIHLLNNPQEAFAAGGLLTRTAEQTLDVHYYIWRKGKTSFLLLNELLMAADRAVRVRRLLDDGGTGGGTR